MRNSIRGRFRVWDRSQDSFNGEDLVYNFDTLDELVGGPNGSSGSSGNEYKGTPSTWLGPNDVIPSSAATKYPGSTNSGYESQTGRRTLYSVVSGLNYNDVPLGTIITWWRPTSTISIPDGWAVCDGRTIAQADHSYPISGSITLPDMRNKMVVGADPATPGINALSGYALEANATSAQNTNNDWTGVQKVAGTAGAPGVGYDSGLETANPRSGSNLPRDLSHNHTAGTLSIKDHYHTISHTHDIESHHHTIPPHSHEHDHVHLMPNHIHDIDAQRTGTEVGPQGVAARQSVKQGTAGPNVVVADQGHSHVWSGLTSNRRVPVLGDGLFFGAGYPIWGRGGLPSDGRNMVATAGGYSIAAVTSRPTLFNYSGTSFNAHTLNTTTSSVGLTTDPKSAVTTISQSNSKSGVITGSTPAEIANSKGLLGSTEVYSAYANIRPQYVGLLYLMKVKVSTNII
jgi:hypothetical protein